MIAVHCMACESHILNTDRERLDYPLTAAMFDSQFGNFVLRPGLLDLEIFCPVCSNFPFNHDPNTPGSRGVGKLLKVKGEDGKLVVLSVKQILMGYQPIKLDTLPSVQLPEASEQAAVQVTPDKQPAATCSECGAKPNAAKIIRHKKGCSIKNPQPEVRHEEERRVLTESVADPFIVALESRVTGRGDDVPPDAPPTKAEVDEMAREREKRTENNGEQNVRQFVE